MGICLVVYCLIGNEWQILGWKMVNSGKVKFREKEICGLYQLRNVVVVVECPKLGTIIVLGCRIRS